MLIYINQTFNLLKSYKINFKSNLYFFNFIYFVFIFLGFIETGYLGTFDYITNFENIRSVIDTRTKGAASYDDWTKVQMTNRNLFINYLLEFYIFFLVHFHGTFKSLFILLD